MNNDAHEKRHIIVGANDCQDNLSTIKGFYLLTEINKMERKSFSFYKSFYEAIQLIDDSNERLKAYEYIVTYWITWQEPEKENSYAYSIFVLAKPHLDANNKKYKKRLNNMGKEVLSRNR